MRALSGCWLDAHSGPDACLTKHAILPDRVLRLFWAARSCVAAFRSGSSGLFQNIRPASVGSDASSSEAPPNAMAEGTKRQAAGTARYSNLQCRRRAPRWYLELNGTGQSRDRLVRMLGHWQELLPHSGMNDSNLGRNENRVVPSMRDLFAALKEWLHKPECLALGSCSEQPIFSRRSWSAWTDRVRTLARS